MVRPGNGPIYVFDTSAWLDCNDRGGDNRIPTLLDALFAAGRICNPKEVAGELERPGALSDWVKMHRTALNHPRGLPPDYARNIGLVQFKFPAMGKALGTKRRADPFVVALALTYHCEEQAWIVVAGETRNNRPRRKIAGACEELGLQCITLDQLIERELPNDE
jgi:hypothetical protein